jgi:hypothetical protein
MENNSNIVRNLLTFFLSSGGKGGCGRLYFYQVLIVILKVIYSAVSTFWQILIAKTSACYRLITSLKISQV